jgi:hypothetical protein
MWKRLSRILVKNIKLILYRHLVGGAYAKVSKENQIQKNISKKRKHYMLYSSKHLKENLTSIILMNPDFV